ncbi:MAG: Crp/Fnr family transcriptional regulator [Leptospira bouyouniensis]|uniref:Crp/Fnr family transcriptional regulator n=1 Tax=Leptospira bouyouniensis TaxID=2484911 RepID=A0A7I0ITX0_9LEPT|nr:Crp/Fnr family transcriptional regulator [Leptospira bouyouniensis]TGL08300.1 Crp/Fnr family transcriptional regulator [Leptospira bouyouniensis]
MTQLQNHTDEWAQIIEIFQNKGKLIKLRKKEFYAKQNESFDSIGYVKKGAFKLVYHNTKKQWIKSFLFEGSFLGSIPSILQKKPSTYSIISIETSEVFVLPKNVWKQLFGEESSFQKFLIQFLTTLYLKKEKRVSDFLLLDARHRYQEFIKEYYPHISRISQIDQAAYLGITNVEVSRLRKRFFANNPE